MAPRRKLQPDRRTLASIAHLRGRGFTMRETARALGVGYTTFKDSLKAEPQLREAWERGKHLYTGALKRRSFELAMSGDRNMLMFLTKRLRGMNKS